MPRVMKPSRAKTLRIGAILIGIAALALIIRWMLYTLLAAGVSVTVLANKESEVLVALAYSFARVWYVYALAVAIGLPLGIVVKPP